MSRPSALKLGASTSGLRWPRSRWTTAPASRVDQGEVAVVAADGEEPPARHERQAADRPARDAAEARAAARSVARVGQRDGAVPVPDGEQPAVRAHGVAHEQVGQRVAALVRPDAEHAAEPPVAGEVPDDDLAVEAAGVERAAVGADREPGDLRGALRASRGPPARRTSQTIMRLSSPAVTAVRPSGLNAARTTPPSWRPSAVRDAPVARSRNRTVPSRPPATIVRPSGLSAAASPPTRQAPQRAQRARVADHGRTALEGRHDVLAAGRDHQRHGRARAGDGTRLADRPAAADVEALDRRWSPLGGLSIVAISERRSAENWTLETNRDCDAGSDVTMRRVAASRTTGCDPATASREPSSLKLHDVDRRPGPPGSRGPSAGGARRAPGARDRRGVSVPSSSRNASVRPSGLRSRLDQRVAVAAEHADRGGALEQRGEQVAARLHASRRAPRPGGRAASRGPGSRPRAPGRRGAAPRPLVASARASPRWSSATRPAITASTSSGGDAGRAPSAAGAGRARSRSGCRRGTRARSG